MRTSILSILGLLSDALAHGGDHGQKPMVADNADWITKHMAEEHHITEWDAASFFILHDFDTDGVWEAEEIQRTYGLFDESNKQILPARRQEIAQQVINMVSPGHTVVTREDFVHFIAAGKTLPDMGTGPGHHGDDEYEYEIHHWEKYHDENTKLEDLTHPEDIEHFKKHEQMEEEAERLEKLNRMGIIEDNIPQKFRRAG